MIQTYFYNERDERIIVSGYIERGMKGLRNIYGKQLTPDDPEEIIIVDSVDENDKDYDMNETERELAEQAIWETL